MNDKKEPKKRFHNLVSHLMGADFTKDNKSVVEKFTSSNKKPKSSVLQKVADKHLKGY